MTSFVIMTAFLALNVDRNLIDNKLMNSDAPYVMIFMSLKRSTRVLRQLYRLRQQLGNPLAHTDRSSPAISGGKDKPT